MTYPLHWQKPNNEYEVVGRTVDQRFFFVPTKEVNDLIRFWLAAAQTKYPGIIIYFWVFMMNHYHGLLRDSESQMSSFMQYFQCNLARGINKLYGRRGSVFEGRHCPSEIVTPEAMVRRFGYCAANPAAATLVDSYAEYPGVILLSTRELMTIEATRFKQGDYDNALRRAAMYGEPVNREDHIEKRSLIITPYERARPEELEAVINDAESEARTERRGRRVIGAAQLKKVDPFSSPAVSKHGRRPLCHAHSREVWFQFRELRRAFVRAYREASAALRDGDLTVKFPAYSFLPGGRIPVPP